MERRPGTPLGRLFEPVDIASLVFFRIAFGALMLWDVFRFVHEGWIESLFIAPAFHFTYEGFAWVRPWPGDGMHWHFWALGVLATFVAAGFLYRLSAALFFLGFTYVFLLEQTLYLNHFYLVCLLSFLMIFVPAHRAVSVDAWLRPTLRSDTVPAWPLWLLRAQMGFVYFFAGVAKLTGDWLQGYPLRHWFAGETALPLVGAYLDQAFVAIAASYAGLLLDLFVVPGLLWHRTRPFAFAASLAFHLMNATIFEIGIFPWLSIAATLLFFDPGWPRRLLRRPAALAPAAASGIRLGSRERLAVALLGLWTAVQVLVPLRPYLYPGNSSWTEEGHRFAWHQMLRWKRGFVRFVLTDPASGRSWEVDPSRILTTRQYGKMIDKPYLILQFAHHLSELATEEGKPRVEVHVSAMCSLNGRELQPLIDHAVDLAAQPAAFLAPYPWIVPLQVPLEAQWDGKTKPKNPVAVALIEEAKAIFLARLEGRTPE